MNQDDAKNDKNQEIPLAMRKRHTPSDPSAEFPLTQRSRNLVRFCRHLPEDSLDASFAGDFGFRDAGSRFAILHERHVRPARMARQ